MNAESERRGEGEGGEKVMRRGGKEKKKEVRGGGKGRGSE